MTDSSSSSLSELSIAPEQTQVVATSYLVTVTAIETVITSGGTDMSAAGSAGSGSSSWVLPSAVDSILSSLVLADSTFGEIEALDFFPSIYA